MSRRAQAPRRDSLPDPKFGNAMLAKFINMVMKSGKKSVAEKIVYNAIERISERVGKDQAAAGTKDTAHVSQCRPLGVERQVMKDQRRHDDVHGVSRPVSA